MKAVGGVDRKRLAWIVGIALGVVGLVALIRAYWEWLDCHHEVLRTLGLVLAGAIGIPLAWWRIREAARQAAAAQQQAAVAQRSLLDEREQRAAEMLGRPQLSVRLGGIYALQALAAEHPAYYHLGIVRLLCAFVRQPTEARTSNAKTSSTETPRQAVPAPTLREDVQAALDAIVARSSAGIELETEADYRLDLRGADLRHWYFAEFYDANLARANLERADLSGAHVSRAILHGAILEKAILSAADLSAADLSAADLSAAELDGADLYNADLSGAVLIDAKLIDAKLIDADLSGAQLRDAVLSRANLTDVRGLTQHQLGLTAILAGAPILNGACDADTGKPLVWYEQEQEPSEANEGQS